MAIGGQLAETTGISTGGGYRGSHGGTRHDIEINIKEFIKPVSKAFHYNSIVSFLD